MRKVAFCVIAPLLVLASIGMQRSSEPEKVGVITGIVVDAAGKPVEKCIVTAQENAQRMRPSVQGFTDKDGKFRIEKVAEGDYNLNVRSPDLKSRAIKSISVMADKTTDTGKLMLKPI